MKIKNILICGLVLLGMVGCDDFESVNTNPDSTNKVTSAMLATELLRDITTYKNGNGKDFIRDELLAKYLSWTEANDIDLALSFADNVDAKMETIREIFTNVPENNVEWQGFNRLLDSNIRRSSLK